MIPKSKIVQRLFELSDTILESMRIDLKILEQWSEKPGEEAWFRRGACFRLKINVGLLEELYLMMEYILLWISGTTRDIENVSRLKCNRVLFFFFFIRWNLNYGRIWDKIFFIMLENLIIGTKNLGIWNILLHIGLIKLRWRIWLVQLRFLFIGLIEFNLINAAKNLVHNCNSLFFFFYWILKLIIGMEYWCSWEVFKYIFYM